MKTDTAQKKLSLDELCSLVGMAKRTVRYYIQRGLVDRPEGSKRGAWYTPRHLEQLMAIRTWQSAGLSLERISQLLDEGVEPSAGPPPPPTRPGTVEVRSHLMLDDGLELVVEPHRANLSPEQVRDLFKRVTEQFEELKKEEGE